MNPVTSTEPELTAFLKTTDLLSKLDEGTLNFLCPKLEKITLAADEILMKEGDPGDCLYLIKQGKLLITIKDNNGKEIVVAERETGESVGEIALLTGEIRSAKVRSACQTELLRLSKSDFENFGTEYPPALDQISQAIINRLQQAQLQQVLHKGELFEDLSEDALRDLEAELTVTMLKGGDHLVYEGDDSDSLHFIISGRLQVVSEQNDGSQKVWTELGRGQTVGEMGILTGDKRSASVVALRDTLVAELSQESFYQLLVKHPRILTKQFAGGIVNRLWGQLQGISHDINTLSTFTVIPASQDASLQTFCHTLTEALAKFGPVLYLNSERLDNLLNKKGAAQTRYDDAYNVNLIRWLSEQETKYRYIVYQADSTATSWSKRCLRQADRILMVSPVKSEPGLGDVGSILDRYGRKINKTLVLLYDNQSDIPLNTKNWLDKTQADDHLHLRQHQRKDFNRLARVLTGHGVGLVLSGGGARAFAHIGAIRVLEEAGLDIDIVGGTSMGAIMAAQYAMGWDARTMLENTKEEVIRHYKMEYTLPVVSLTTGNAWGNFLRSFYGEKQIEDLWLNFFCCSSNLTDTQLRIHEQGSLWKSVRASTSIPGLIPPVFDNGSILVDGAVLNNMPVDIMRGRNNGGSVYAIDAGGGMSSSELSEFDPVLSGWQLFFRRKKNQKDVPKMMSILMQSAMMGSQMTLQTTQRMADLYIKPDVSAFSILDFKMVEKIVEQGYRSANEQLEQWLIEQKTGS